MKHTPGPWIADKSVSGEDVLWWVDGDHGDRNVCDLYHRTQSGEFVPKENDEANARLISAAPDMYEALENVPRPSGSKSWVEWRNEFHAWWDQVARAAIAKAEGREP